MFFLLRMAFWLTLAFALLPTGSTQPQAQAQAKGPQVGAGDAVAAAGAAVSDASGFCARQPEACEVGSQAAVAIGQRAQAGAQMVYDLIQQRMARSATGSVPEAKVVPASITARATPPHPASHSTLRPADLAPEWRGPAPGKEAKPRRDIEPRREIEPRRDAEHRRDAEPRRDGKRPA